MPTGEKLGQTREAQNRCIFDLPPDFFDSCQLLPPHTTPISQHLIDKPLNTSNDEITERVHQYPENFVNSESSAYSRLSCHTCNIGFESLQEHRYHFASDFHRLNVKLILSGKNTIREDDFDELDSFLKDCEISSISGSEDESDTVSFNSKDIIAVASNKHRLFFRLKTGDKISIWRCLLLDESTKINYCEGAPLVAHDDMFSSYLTSDEVIDKLRSLTDKHRDDNNNRRVVLLCSGGHFAACVFDGNLVVAHKTFHRYVVRGRAGKKQSSKDAGGKTIHSAGASLRRYNELALKKEIQEVLAAWKPYLETSSSVFIHAPSSNRKMIFGGDKANFNAAHTSVRSVPFTVRRPTFKEAQRIHNQLTKIFYEVNDEQSYQCGSSSSLVDSIHPMETFKNTETFSSSKDTEESSVLIEHDDIQPNIVPTLPLHEAAHSGKVEKVLKLLNLGVDPCTRDGMGRTPYMLATDKEVRNTFRRFMAANLDKWDWNSAMVPSALTPEMEISQAAKQAEKAAKRRAISKEMKKSRKAKEKKTTAEAALVTCPNTTRGSTSSLASGMFGPGFTSRDPKEEKKSAEEEREKRAAAAERRIVAAAMTGMGGCCTYCKSSLAGKVPFHRYNFKYCCTTCMHLHQEESHP